MERMQADVIANGRDIATLNRHYNNTRGFAEVIESIQARCNSGANMGV